MPIQTDEDRPGMLRQRNPEAVFTEGAEKANIDNQQGLLGTLFARKDEMHRRCEDQLGGLFATSEGSYGRVRAVGMSADEASRIVTRAFKG